MEGEKLQMENRTTKETIDFKALIESSSYGFLRNKKIFPAGIMMLGLGGSYAYDTFKTKLKEGEKPSDIDMRGIAFNTLENLLYLKNYEQEQYLDEHTDSVVYYFNKYSKLLYGCNPNILEIIGLPPHKIYIDSPEAKLLRENSSMFLTKMAYYSFGRFAEDQLQRVLNALNKESIDSNQKEKHLLKSVLRQLHACMEDCAVKLKITEEIKLYIDESFRDGCETEIYIDCDFKHYPLREFMKNINVMGETVKTYEKINKRKEKPEEKLEKHCMHLVRLLKMCIEILSGKGIITSREIAGDVGMLLDIRSRKIPLIYVITDLYQQLMKEVEYAYKNTELPEKVDWVKTKELIMEINRMSLVRYSDVLGRTLLAK